MIYNKKFIKKKTKMFTGIIKETGKIIKIKNSISAKEIEVKSYSLIKNLETGDSVAVNGCCLTVKKLNESSFLCDISFSTLNSTTFRFIKIGEFVNLEDSLLLNGKLGGHFVTGHIDAVARILKIIKIGNSYKIEIKSPGELLQFLAPKGSISVDGISLTIADSTNRWFSTAIIPFTFSSTNLKFKKSGDLVNLEVDLISRYIEQSLKSKKNKLTQDSKNQISKISNDINTAGDLNSYANGFDDKNNNNEKTKEDNLKEKLTKHGFIK
ncbi:MAG: riboflavin synthase [Actinobacteria bacterium]|nr:riboflavin synthase [Actinomycetota bacterium]